MDVRTDAHTVGREAVAPGEIALATRSLLRAGVVLGIGIVGTLDAVVLHELLQWHNFYVHTMQPWRIFIDGIFHFVTAGLLFLGAMLLWARRHQISRQGVTGRTLAAGILFGMGGFNLYDGTIQHKVLQFHPVREGVDTILPYDLAFNGVALVLLAAAWMLWRSVQVQEARRLIPPAIDVYVAGKLRDAPRRRG